MPPDRRGGAARPPSPRLRRSDRTLIRLFLGLARFIPPKGGTTCAVEWKQRIHNGTSLLPHGKITPKQRGRLIRCLMTEDTEAQATLCVNGDADFPLSRRRGRGLGA